MPPSNGYKYIRHEGKLIDIDQWINEHPDEWRAIIADFTKAFKEADRGWQLIALTEDKPRFEWQFSPPPLENDPCRREWMQKDSPYKLSSLQFGLSYRGIWGNAGYSGIFSYTDPAFDIEAEVAQLETDILDELHAGIIGMIEFRINREEK